MILHFQIHNLLYHNNNIIEEKQTLCMGGSMKYEKNV